MKPTGSSYQRRKIQGGRIPKNHLGRPRLTPCRWIGPSLYQCWRCLSSISDDAEIFSPSGSLPFQTALLFFCFFSACFILLWFNCPSSKLTFVRLLSSPAKLELNRPTLLGWPTPPRRRALPKWESALSRSPSRHGVLIWIPMTYVIFRKRNMTRQRSLRNYPRSRLVLAISRVSV